MGEAESPRKNSSLMSVAKMWRSGTETILRRRHYIWYYKRKGC